MKLKLDLKVTEIKEELEKVLKETNDVLLSCEKTNKAIKYYEKKNINHEIRSLYYISEINESNERAKKLFEKPMRNINIFLYLGNKLFFEDYYFNKILIKKNNNPFIDSDNAINNNYQLFFDNNQKPYDI